MPSSIGSKSGWKLKAMTSPVPDHALMFDPGVSSGIALVSYTPTTVPVLVGSWQFTGGVMGLKEWLRVTGPSVLALPGLTVAAEKFTARNTKGFSYTTASLEALRGEGALIMDDWMPDYSPKEKRWRDPTLQYLVGGKDLADKKKRQHAFLKGIGFYRTNADFPESPSKDGADDFRSAAAHLINYLAREKKHEPSFRLMTEWSAS